jgi:hypothetical protein
LQHKQEQELADSHEALQKRKEAAKAELGNLKAAREIQKRMGKALLRNLAEAREKEDKVQQAILAQDTEKEEKKKAVKQSKSVSFANLPEHQEGPVNRARIREKEVRLDGGDVALARLKTGERLTRNQLAKLPMKMDVVERVSGVPSDAAPDIAGDSDDESLPASPDGTDDGEDGNKLESSTDNEDDSDHNPDLEDEYDFDTAEHQREIALEYYKKRDTIGREVATAMTSHTHAEDDWNQPVCFSKILMSFFDLRLLCRHRKFHWKLRCLPHHLNHPCRASRPVDLHLRTLPLCRRLHWVHICFQRLLLVRSSGRSGLESWRMEI